MAGHLQARLQAALMLAAFSSTGCSNGARAVLPYMQSGPAIQALNGTGAGKITHVVFIVQENRSFDNLFQAIPARTPCRAGKTRRARRSCFSP